MDEESADPVEQVLALRRALARQIRAQRTATLTAARDIVVWQDGYRRGHLEGRHAVLEAVLEILERWRRTLEEGAR